MDSHLTVNLFMRTRYLSKPINSLIFFHQVYDEIQETEAKV